MTVGLEAGTTRFPQSSFDFESGTQWGGFQEHVHRPPVFTHVQVFAGQFLRLDRSAFPAPSAQVARVRNGMTNGDRRAPIALGWRRWSGLRGQLSITPSIYPRDGGLADVVVFRWRDVDGDRAVALNVWEPFTDTVRTLRVVVAGLAPQPAPTRPPSTRNAGQVAMTTPPRWIRVLCDSAHLLHPACPSALPVADAAGTWVTLTPSPSSGPPRSVEVSIEWYAARVSKRNPHPPQFGHVEISAGQMPTPRPHAQKPTPISRIRIPTGYLPIQPIPLGRPPWTTPPGQLLFGTPFGNHIAYRWRDPRHTYQIDLHAWYPLVQTRAVLRAIVRSTPSR